MEGYTEARDIFALGPVVTTGVIVDLPQPDEPLFPDTWYTLLSTS